MTRGELEHLIRAAGDIASDDLVVIGSQAILAAHPQAPSALLVSMEADVYPRNSPEDARLIDAEIGDGSSFHDSYGYYAHGVGPETAKAPEGWEGRLIQIAPPPIPKTRPLRSGWCLEPHDLMLAKLARGEQRDRDFVEVCIRMEMVDIAVLRERAPTVPLEFRDYVVEGLEGVIAQAASSGS